MELKGNEYRIGKLDAMRQLHVSRRIAPIIPTLVPVFLKIAQQGDVMKDLAGVAELCEPFAEALAEMSDEHSEYIFATCLSVVKRQTSPTNFAPVWSASAKACMFDDIDLGDMIQLVLAVIQDSLGPFIRGLLTSQTSRTE